MSVPPNADDNDDLVFEALKFLGKNLSGPKDAKNIWQKLMIQDYVPIEDYRDLWRHEIHNASQSGKIMSNGWAFSTMSGVAVYENEVRSDLDFGRLYRDRSEAIPNAVNLIANSIAQHRLGGIIIYGFGNLVREAQLIESLISASLIRNAKKGGTKVYLIDCSAPYFLFAKSRFNPLLQHVHQKQLFICLRDFVSASSDAKDEIRYWRNDMNPFHPVLHVFMGNTFGNIEKDDLHRVLTEFTVPGDLVLAEYASYTSDYFDQVDSDYASTMACVATAELFSVKRGDVKTKNVKRDSQSKYVEISFTQPQGDGREISFKSMLRRQFISSDVTNNAFTSLQPIPVIPNKVQFEIFKRSPSE